jgi:hypothetical protein
MLPENITESDWETSNFSTVEIKKHIQGHDTDLEEIEDNLQVQQKKHRSSIKLNLLYNFL